MTTTREPRAHVAPLEATDVKWICGAIDIPRNTRPEDLPRVFEVACQELLRLMSQELLRAQGAPS